MSAAFVNWSSWRSSSRHDGGADLGAWPVNGQLWPEILRKIDGPVAADSPADEFEDCDDAEDEYDPVEPAQADQDCWTQCARRD